jgi:hypothetical protein
VGVSIRESPTSVTKFINSKYGLLVVGLSNVVLFMLCGQSKCSQIFLTTHREYIKCMLLCTMTFKLHPSLDLCEFRICDFANMRERNSRYLLAICEKISLLYDSVRWKPYALQGNVCSETKTGKAD